MIKILTKKRYEELLAIEEKHALQQIEMTEVSSWLSPLIPQMPVVITYLKKGYRNTASLRSALEKVSRIRSPSKIKVALQTLEQRLSNKESIYVGETQDENETKTSN